jgi:plasmid stability protein
MTTMTIRGLDDLTIKALKEKAKKEGSSVNAALVKLLQEALGLKKKKRTVVYNDLDHLAGTWSDKDYKEFLQATADFAKIDENVWK